MNEYFDVEQFDKNTLKFAINIAHQYEFLCKNTKEGRIQAQAFSEVQSTLQHYLQELDKNNLTT